MLSNGPALVGMAGKKFFLKGSSVRIKCKNVSPVDVWIILSYLKKTKKEKQSK